jgi:hypothetical protein
MRMRRPGCLILLVLGLLLPVFGRGAHAQATAEADTTLNLPNFPKGKLSPEQLAEVAAAIRRLEANPLAADSGTPAPSSWCGSSIRRTSPSPPART